MEIIANVTPRNEVPMPRMGTRKGANMETVAIHGRKWFDKVNGNTYHAVAVEIDGEAVGKVSFEYGYGEAYLDTALRIMEQLGHVDDHFNAYPPSRHFREAGIDYSTTVQEVRRKGDLVPAGWEDVPEVDIYAKG